MEREKIEMMFRSPEKGMRRLAQQFCHKFRIPYFVIVKPKYQKLTKRNKKRKAFEAKGWQVMEFSTNRIVINWDNFQMYGPYKKIDRPAGSKVYKINL